MVTSGRRVGPALGLLWSSCVNTRLFMARRGAGGAGGRDLRVVFSPHLPSAGCRFEVTKDGVAGLSEEE
eukprot:1188410-Prorocentrum_minimum.AAC.4